MKIGSVSTHVMHNSQRQILRQGQSDLLKAGYESVMGRVSDPGLTLGRRTGRFLDTENHISLLNELKATNGLVAERMAASQLAIKSLVYAPGPKDKEPEGALVHFNKILLGTSSGESTSKDLSIAAQTALDAFVSALNTNLNGEFVFGGTNTREAPFSYYKAGSNEGASKVVRQAFSDHFGFPPDDPAAANITKEEMQDFIDGSFSDLFKDPSWGINFSKADDAVQKNRILPDGEAVDTSVSANEEAFRQTMKNLILVAEFADGDFSDDAKMAVKENAQSSSGISMGDAINKISIVASSLGGMERRVQSANEHFESQLGILESIRAQLIGVDQTEAAVRVEEINLMMSISYQLTAQISRLSLVNYL